MMTHEVRYIILASKNHEICGIGECSPIWKLSPESPESFEEALDTLQKNSFDFDEFLAIQSDNPSIRFAIETACLDYLNGGKRRLFDRGAATEIKINGLVWMNDKDSMLKEAEEKIKQGFDTIKFKVGALNFSEELELLSVIRKNFGDDITIRLDANGAFNADDALKKLEALAVHQIHSIEQPIKPGQGKLFADIILNSSIPIALDEELIGMHELDEKKRLLDLLQPHYLVLKPTLHHGFSGCDEWIELAEVRKIGWWITSALESNIGLNAIAQWTAVKRTLLPQGLGTGGLYTNNIPSPMVIESGKLHWSDSSFWDESEILSL